MAQVKVLNNYDDQNLKYLTALRNAATPKVKHQKNLKTIKPPIKN